MPLVRAGKVLKPHGVQGFVRCALTGDNPTPLSDRGPYWLYDPRSSELLPLEDPQFDHAAGSESFLLRANGWNAPEPLRIYQGCDLLYLARKGAMPREADEVYFFELVGLEVRDTQGKPVARVVEVLQTGAGVLLELDTRPPRLIPFHAAMIPELNLAEGYLVTAYGDLGREDAR